MLPMMLNIISIALCTFGAFMCLVSIYYQGYVRDKRHMFQELTKLDYTTATLSIMRPPASSATVATAIVADGKDSTPGDPRVP